MQRDKRAQVIVVGSLNMDLIIRAARLPRLGETLCGSDFAAAPGGKGANQAVAAARLGARTAMIGCVGGDAHGAALRAALTAAGIDCDGISTDPQAPSGVALVVVDHQGGNAVVVSAGSNGRLTPEAIERHETLLADADVVVCQMEIPAETAAAALATARRCGCTTLLNPAPATAPLPDDWLRQVDYLVPNEIEAAALTGIAAGTPGFAPAAAQALHAQGAANVLITLGARGVFVLAADGTARHFAAPRVVARDTTGAGDTFVGGLAAALAARRPLAEAIRFAQAAAALSVTRTGAQASIPALPEVQAALRAAAARAADAPSQ